MDPLFHLLGVAARFGERLSRIRINFIPINWAVMAFCFVGAVASAAGLTEGLANSGSPHTLRVADVLARRGTDRNYVRVSGVLHPEATLTETDERSKSVDHVWAPLLDGTGKKGILVELKDADVSGRKPGVVTITGLLHSPPRLLGEELDKRNGKLEEVSIGRELVLEEGAAPGDPLWMGAALLACGGGGLLLLISFCMQYVVFRKTDEVPADRPGAAEAPLRATGRFNLDGKHSQRFLNVPVGFAVLESGHPALLSNIDASSRYMGITTSKRAGLWGIILQPNSVKEIEKGLLYVGFATLPALRFRFVDASDGSTATAIVSCESAAAREEALDRLTRPVEITPPPPAASSSEGLPIAQVIPEPAADSSAEPPSTQPR